MAGKRPNGDGSIYPIKDVGDKVVGWRAQITFADPVTLREQKTSKRFKQQFEAIAWLDEMKRKRKDRALTSASKTPLSKYLDDWLENKPRQIKLELGHRTLEDLNGAHLDMLYRKMIKKGLAPAPWSWFTTCCTRR